MLTIIDDYKQPTCTEAESSGPFCC